MASAKQGPESNKLEPAGERRHLPRHEPTLIDRFANEIERLFDDFGFGRVWDDIGKAEWTPQIEVLEHADQFIVRADLPGMSSNDVNVDITDNSLTIQGERKQEHKEEREGWYRSERSYGSFFRRILLPEGVNVDEAKASFRDGVLEITVPAPKRGKRRRSIEIK